MDYTIGGTGPAQLRDLQRRLRAASQSSGDKTLNGLLRRRMRERMGPAKQQLQRAVLAAPSSGGAGGGHSTRGRGKRSVGLRKRISQLVQVRAQTSGRDVGVRIRIDASRMPDDQRSLPAMLEGSKPWRHPVYGHRDRWVSQGSHAYFWPTVTAGRDTWRQAIEAAVDDVKAALRGSS